MNGNNHLIFNKKTLSQQVIAKNTTTFGNIFDRVIESFSIALFQIYVILKLNERSVMKKKGIYENDRTAA